MLFGKVVPEQREIVICGWFRTCLYTTTQKIVRSYFHSLLLIGKKKFVGVMFRCCTYTSSSISTNTNNSFLIQFYLFTYVWRDTHLCVCIDVNKISLTYSKQTFTTNLILYRHNVIHNLHTLGIHKLNCMLFSYVIHMFIYE